MRRAALLVAASLAVLAPPPARAQGDLGATLSARAEKVPAARRTFRETWLLPPDGGTAAGPEGLAFAGRATVLQEGRRERIEIAKVEGDRLAPPIVIVGDGKAYWLLTRVGATPLASTAAAADPLVRLVLAGPPGVAPAHRTVPGDDGGIRGVALRHAGPVDFDADRAFAIRETALGGAVSQGLSSFSAAGDSRVVAAAGARGVDRVRTANGTVAVTPDPAAVAWMDSIAVDPMALEAFRREGRLPPWRDLPGSDAPEDGS